MTGFLSGLFLFCYSCGTGSFYEHYQPVKDRYWEKEAEYYFSVEVTDTLLPYDISVEIRNNNLYPYQNFWLFCAEELPSGNIQKDTIEFLLADDYGKWLGKGISLFHSSVPIRKSYYFPEPGTYTFSFRQGMRNDRLPGIQEIGLKIITSDQ